MFYNYIYLDPRKPGRYIYNSICLLYEPFYVGKGKGDRCYYHIKKISRVDNPLFKNKINKLIRQDISPYIIKLNHTVDEQESYRSETELIMEIGSDLIEGIPNGTLLNICLYNNPPNLKGKSYKEIYGDKWEEELYKRTKKQKEVGGYFKGKKHKDESKKKISESLKGRNNPMWDKSHTDETKNKISQKAKERLSKHNHFWKKYKVTSPNGEIYTIEDGLEKFCEDHNISYSTLRKCLSTNKKPNKGRTKDWYLEYNE